MNKKSKTALVAGLALIAVSVCGFAEVDENVLKQGKLVYEQHCARCHGIDGKGDGPDAKRVPVTPRNFTLGAYKFRTTASGTPPSDEDLLYVINHGLSGSGMPSFANLNHDVKLALVQYVKSFSSDFSQYQPEPLTPVNEKAKVNLSVGKEVYDKLQCALCHGSGGRANGTSAATLTDSLGAPIKAADLTQGWTYRAGHAPKDIYYRLMAGLAGTPMPSYDGAITPDEAWQLANYVRTMQLDVEWSNKIIAVKSQTDLPTALNDAAWKKAPSYGINLDGGIYSGGQKKFASVTSLTVQAVSAKDGVAFRLAWSDPVMDKKGLPDRLLVAIKPIDYKGERRDNLHNAYTSDAAPFDALMWSANEEGTIKRKRTNLYGVAERIGNAERTLKCEARYTDGLWEVMFIRPFEAEEVDREAIPLGFAVWNGDNNESGKKYSASQWIPLVLNKKETHH